MPARRHLRGCQNMNSAFGCELCKLMATTRPSTHWPYRPGEPVEYRTTEESKYYARYIVGVWSENVKITIIF